MGYGGCGLGGLECGVWSELLMDLLSRGSMSVYAEGEVKMPGFGRGFPFRTKVPTVGFDGNQGWGVLRPLFRLVCPRNVSRPGPYRLCGHRFFFVSW